MVADALDAALLQEAGRVKDLHHGRVPYTGDSALSKSAFDSYLPAVLQQSSHLPQDLPTGFVDALEARLMQYLRKLHKVGHLGRVVNFEYPATEGEEIIANDLELYQILNTARESGDAGDARFKTALEWALVEMRYRNTMSTWRKIKWGDPFTQLSKIWHCDRDVAELGFVRSSFGQPFLHDVGEGERELLAMGYRQNVPRELVVPMDFCLGRWTGAAGRPFRIGVIPGDPAIARQAIDILVRTGLLDVMPSPHT